ncbi:hypothetical protein NM688_g2846 [Phlebia brevispora]|uniref:Uncharacterized protein n=1 Tax=Phlebia brevispora TaxID=194682 RepID=A0ACC1T7C3_9APHY|nr:hypothetical protein NM688_g2846 [Phlebia brevispora]
MPEPLPIRRLEDSVINRIAAGEIIQRPSSALKELLENSLDAGSTSIKITVKDGGMKLLQIQDNGCGIRKEDLPVLAQRFTTSKISSFEDLQSLQTYGFRGEALASISYVSNLSVITKTKADECAWKATYEDGVLISKDGSPAAPKPCAGNDGTTIMAENLFYNTPARLSALRSSSEEYSRILDVVTKYAVHNPRVSFSCKKAGSPTPELSTPSASSVKDAIGITYGQTIAKALLHVQIPLPEEAPHAESMDVDEEKRWSADIYCTNPNYQAKKLVLLLFINHRLVESTRIRKAVEAVYVGILPKGMSPFIYVSLQIDPHAVDVNVHPTKREVHFLDEEIIIQRVSDAIHDALIDENESRTFEYQTLLTGGIAPTQGVSTTKVDVKGKKRARSTQSSEEEEASSSIAAPVLKKTLSQHKVRTSQSDRTLDSMFPVINPSQKDNSSAQEPLKPPEIPESDCLLASVKILRERIALGKHEELTEILQKHTFVGIVDLGRCLSLIQHAKKLYLVNHGALAEELFYHLGVRQFGDYHRIKLDPPAPVRKLIKLAVDAERGIADSGLSQDQVVDLIFDRLMNTRPMLREYFHTEISDDGLLETLPLLLKGYTPNLDKLPLFLMRLGPQVNWTSEVECFESFLRELAYFYVPEPIFSHSDEDERDEGTTQAVKWQIQHVIFPAMAKYLQAPKPLLDRDVVQVAHLPDLYRNTKCKHDANDSFSPTAQSNPVFFKDPDFVRVAETYDTTPFGQIAISWAVHATAVVPKSANIDRMKASIQASVYGSEEEVGTAIRESGVPRSEIFLTTKLWNTSHQRVREAFEESFAALNCEYINLYLMHWPQAEVDGRVLDASEHPTFIDTWKEMEKLLENGKVKSIGVSNFSIKHLETLLPHCKVIPVTNQVELHPCLPETALKEYCEAKGIILTAYSPFDEMQDRSWQSHIIPYTGQSNSLFFKDPDFVRVADAHGANVGQLAISWAVQRGTAVMPKSANTERMKINIKLVRLSLEDMETIDNIHRKP